MMRQGMRAKPRRLGQALAVVAFCGLLVPVAKAQQLTNQARSLATQLSETTLATRNLAFTVNLASLVQSYAENDPFGLANGMLDTERGFATTQSWHRTGRPHEANRHPARNRVITLNL